MKALIGVLTTAVVLALPAMGQSFLTNGLLAYYPLAGNANDASGHGRNGVLQNVTFTQDRFGGYGHAAQFSGQLGTNSAVNCPALNALPYFPISYSCWFLLGSNLVVNADYPSSGVGFMMLVGRHQSDNAASCGAFGLFSSEHLLSVTNQLAYFYPPQGAATTSTRVQPAGNTWYHGVLTIDGSGLVSLYLNGSLIGTSAVSPTTLAGAGGLPFRIGDSTYDLAVNPNGNPTAKVYSWRGAIDDVRIYNRALSSDEVAQLYAYESVPGPCVPYSATATARVDGGYVVGITPTDSGCGYTNTPVVYIVGGGGTGASAIATVANGLVLGVTITSPGAGYTSVPQVYFGPAPQISQQPQGLTVLNGRPASFSVAAWGETPPSYQWRKNGTNLTDGAGISGSATNILELGAASPADAGAYSVVISNAYGSITSSPATLVVLVGAPTNGLVAHYPLAGSAADASGNGNDGVLRNVTFVQDRFGAYSRAAQFSGQLGTNSAVDCPTLGALPWYPLTYACWFLMDSNLVLNVDYPSAGVGLMMLLGRYQSDNAGACGAFGLFSSEQLLNVTNQLAYFYPPQGAATTSARVQPAANTWYQGVLTIDDNALVSMYLDGSLLGTNALSPAALAVGGPLPFRIGDSTYDPIINPGGNPVAKDYSWRGAINDVRVYNRALSTIEVAQLYAYDSLPLPCVPYSATATATVVGGFVVGITPTDSGCGYTNTPSVYIVGGGGAGATATATVTNGLVVGVTVTSAGVGYTSLPQVFFESPLGPIPEITQDPLGLTVTNGTPASFTVSVWSQAPLGYQWQKNGSTLRDGGGISGSATATLRLGATTVGDSGAYSVIVSNAYGSVTSGIATLTVIGAPIISVQPLTQAVLVGATVVLNVSALSGVPMTFQWSFDGTNLPGTTNATLTLANVQSAQSGTYAVAITNAAGYTLSSNATLTIFSPPQILTQPAGALGYWGATTGFQVAAQGTPPLSYQWYFDNQPISWATNATLLLTNLVLTEAGDYSVRVTNLYGSVLSAPATLVVNPAGVSLGLYGGLTITGTVGKTVGIQYSSSVGGSAGWTTLTNLTLVQPVELWIDTSVQVNQQGQRFYRVVAAP